VVAGDPNAPPESLSEDWTTDELSRPFQPVSHRLFRGFGFGERLVGADHRDCVELRIDGFAPLQVRLPHLSARQLFDRMAFASSWAPYERGAVIALTLARTLSIALRDGLGWQYRLPYFGDITIRW